MNDRTETAALLLRLGLGTMFIAHGLLKVMVFTLPGTVGFFEQVGFPGWLAYVVTFAEIGGGILLIAGVAGWLFSSPNGGWEYPAFLVLASVVQALLGPGKFAVELPFLARTRTA
jgi:putative oxidoreductase